MVYNVVFTGLWRILPWSSVKSLVILLQCHNQHEIKSPIDMFCQIAVHTLMSGCNIVQFNIVLNAKNSPLTNHPYFPVCPSWVYPKKHIHTVRVWFVFAWYRDDVIKWKHFSRYWPFVRGIHRSPLDSPYNGQWGGALMFSLICAWTNNYDNNLDASDLKHHRAHYDVTVMWYRSILSILSGLLHWYRDYDVSQC